MQYSVVELAVFLGATFLAAFINGLAGFAFALIAAAVWLHILSPAQSAALIACYGLLIQGLSAWKLRRAISWSLLWPFLLGGLFGIPLGVLALGWATPPQMRAAIGVFLVAYATYSLARPRPATIESGRIANAGVGFLNGFVGGATGFGAIIVTIWCSWLGWPKDRQRAVFQPIAVATFVVTLPLLGAQGALTADVLRLGLLGLPAVLAGLWLGLKLYDRIDEVAFRRIVLVLVLASGIGLLLAAARLLSA